MIAQKSAAAAAVRLHQHTQHSPAFLDQHFSSAVSPACVRRAPTYSPPAHSSLPAARDDLAASTRSAEVQIRLMPELTGTENNFAYFPQLLVLSA